MAYFFGPPCRYKSVCKVVCMLKQECHVTIGGVGRTVSDVFSIGWFGRNFAYLWAQQGAIKCVEIAYPHDYTPLKLANKYLKMQSSVVEKTTKNLTTRANKPV